MLSSITQSDEAFSDLSQLSDLCKILEDDVFQPLGLEEPTALSKLAVAKLQRSNGIICAL
jgi:hypothetical protein